MWDRNPKTRLDMFWTFRSRFTFFPNRQIKDSSSSLEKWRFLDLTFRTWTLPRFRGFNPTICGNLFLTEWLWKYTWCFVYIDWVQTPYGQWQRLLISFWWKWTSARGNVTASTFRPHCPLPLKCSATHHPESGNVDDNLVCKALDLDWIKRHWSRRDLKFACGAEGKSGFACIAKVLCLQMFGILANA